MRLRVPGNSALTRFFLGPVGRLLIMGGAVFTILFLGVFIFFYARYSKVIDEKLRAGPFANNAKIFAAPESVGVGDALSSNDIAAELRRSGYSELRGNSLATTSSASTRFPFSRAPIPISTRKPASSSSPAGGFRRSSPCRTIPRAANTSWNRSSSPTSRAPAARSGGW